MGLGLSSWNVKVQTVPQSDYIYVHVAFPEHVLTIPIKLQVS